MQKLKITMWVLLIAFMLIPAKLITAQDESTKKEIVYSLGQQTISISAGLFIPLFFQSFSGEVIGETNLSLGGCASLQWGAYLSNHWLLGVEVGGIFSRSIRKNYLWMLPITVKGSYVFHIYPFEFPVFFAAGMNILKYESQAHINFILKPGFSSLWKATASWAFGLNFVYWWVLQPWKDDPEKGRMGNFLEITLIARYNF